MLRRSLSALLLLPFVALASPAQFPSIDKGRTEDFNSKEYSSTRVLGNSLERGETPFTPDDNKHKMALGFRGAEYVYPFYGDAIESFQRGQFYKVLNMFADRLSYLSREKDRMREKSMLYQRA